MKKFNKKLFLRYSIFILIVAIIIFLIMLFSNKETEGYTSPPPAVEIIKPQNTDIQQSISISGYVEALDMIPVVPFVSGTIMEYPIKSGMKINKGDLIAKIDDEPYKQQMLQAKAAYLGYQSTFERVENLYKANAATQQNYDSAKAQRDAAKAQYDLAILQMSYTEVTSPSTGTVLMAPLAKGSIGSTQQPAAIIADLSKQVVRLNVPEKYFDLFNQDKSKINAIIKRPGLEGFSEDTICLAEIDTISPYIQPESKTFQVVFNLTNNLDLFRPGMYVDVIVNYAEYKNVPTLPLEVLKVDGSCYIYNEENSTVEHVNFPTEVRDEKYFLIPTEFSNKDFVINGQGFVFDGQKVKVVNSEKKLIELNDFSKTEETKWT